VPTVICAHSKLCIKCQHDLVIARKKKTAAYWVYVKLKGKQAWERIGSLTIARERERSFRKEIEEKRYLAKHETLIDFYNDVFLPYSKREKRSSTADEYHFVHVVKHFGADTRLTDITPEAVENYKEIRTQEGRKNATVNRELALLRSIINKADKMGRFIGKNPVSKLLPENNSHIARSLSEDETRKLFAELNLDTRIWCSDCGLKRFIGTFVNGNGCQISTHRACNHA
jgi:Phage integrase SAM-like domain